MGCENRTTSTPLKFHIKWLGRNSVNFNLKPSDNAFVWNDITPINAIVSSVGAICCIKRNIFKIVSQIFAGSRLLNTDLGQDELDCFVVIDDIYGPTVSRTCRIMRGQTDSINGYSDTLIGEVNVFNCGHGESDGIIVPALVEADIDSPVVDADTRTAGTSRPYIKSVKAAGLHP